MKKVLTTSVVALMLCAHAVSQTKRTTKSKKPSSTSLTAREIARRSLPSVVVLIARDAKGKAVTLGSGFFVTPSIVATNLHVIEDASQVTAKFVTGDRGEYGIDGSVAIDEEHDLALLQIGAGIGTGDERYFTPLGRPLSVAGGGIRGEIGDTVYVVGNPEGLEGTFSQGIISAFRGSDYIQITAPISPGSSGGPVMNQRGDVIGVATLFIKEGQNLNFAIPASRLVLLLGKVTNARPLVPRAKVAFDGLYRATFRTVVCNPPYPGCDGSEIVEWLRFHEDGSVFMTSTPRSAWPNGFDLDKIFDWLSQRSEIEPYHGRYMVRGSDVEFTMYLGTNKDSSYSGTIQSNGLLLVEHLANGGDTPTYEYDFVKVDSKTTTKSDNGLFVAPSPTPNSDEWRLVDFSNTFRLYYRPSSVLRTPNGTLKVWGKDVPINLEERRKEEAARQTDNRLSFKYYSYAYSLELFEVRCEAREDRLLAWVDYDTNNSTLSSSDDANAEWSNIIPGSVMDSLRKTICPQH
jgi:S1-C subfamily serine protease